MQLASYHTYGGLDHSARKQKLTLLKKALDNYSQQLIEAVHLDFAKNKTETKITEIYPLYTELRKYRRNLRSWMQDDNRDTSLVYLGTRAKVRYESKGVCLIIAPWNYPILLTLGPLIAAIAAGNTVIIKPSEMTPHTSRVIQKMIRDTFPTEYIDVVNGAVETSQYLLSKPFHHIFFTGSPKVGKKIMEAASKNLSSVTLELGGKSPAIITADANISKAARRIVWGKGINSGQTCIAPDYILVHENVKEELLKNINNQIQKMFSDPDQIAGIISEDHFQRLKKLYPAARGEKDFFPIQTISQPEQFDDLRNEEIFGPLLPVYSYREMSEVIQFINKGTRPLAMYFFGKVNKEAKKLIQQTRSGGLVINHTLIHFSHPNLPFGGVNHSGIGRYHGKEGFIEFSNARSVLHQKWSLSLASLIFPPYNKWKNKIVDLLIKYL